MATQECAISSVPPGTHKKLGQPNVNIKDMSTDDRTESGVRFEDPVLYKQDDHLSNISFKLKHFREAKIMCDVEINVGTVSVFAHKCVLAAGSAKLKSLFSDSDQVLPVAQIHLPVRCPKSFEYVIDYLYTGYLSVSFSNLSELITLGNMLEIDGVSPLCCRHLEESLTIENWSTVFTLSAAHNLNVVLEAAINFAIDYFSLLSSSNAFKELKYANFKPLLSKYNVENDPELEMTRLKEILLWINHSSEREAYTTELLELVKLQNFEPDSPVESSIKSMHLKEHVLSNPAFKTFFARLEELKSSTPGGVAINDDISGTLRDLPESVDTHHDRQILKQEQDSENESDNALQQYVSASDDNLEHGDKSTSPRKKKQKTVVPEQRNPDNEEGTEEECLRKCVKSKRLRKLYKVKSDRSGPTRRPRGRPSKKIKQVKKPRMKTSCTQVASENIENEFEEIAREERDREDFDVENDEKHGPKLETIDRVECGVEETRKTRGRLRPLIIRKKKERNDNKPREVCNSRNKATDVSYSHDTDVSDVSDDEYIPVEKAPKKSCHNVKNLKRPGKGRTTSVGLDVVKDTATQKFLCPEPNCSFTSRFRGSLLRHKQTMHDKTHIRCKLCGTIVTPDELEEHHKRFHSVDLMCGVCGKLVKSSAELRNHTLQYHTDPEEFKYQCSHCGKRFHHKSNYQGHMDSHNDVKSWLCQLCHKGFSFRSSLLRHVKICKGKKPKKRTYPCESCGLVFKLKDYLNQHMIGKHSGQLKYPCICGRNFAWRGSLVNHKKTCKITLASKIEKTEEPTTPQQRPDEDSVDVKIKVIPVKEETQPPPSNESIDYLTVTDPTAIMQSMGINIQDTSQPYHGGMESASVQTIQSQAIETLQPAANSPSVHQASDSPALQQSVLINTATAQPSMLPAIPQLLNTTALQPAMVSTEPSLAAVVHTPNVEMPQTAGISYAQALALQLPIESVSSLLFHNLQQGAVVLPVSSFQQPLPSNTSQMSSTTTYTQANTPFTFQQNQQLQ